MDLQIKQYLDLEIRLELIQYSENWLSCNIPKYEFSILTIWLLIKM